MILYEISLFVVMYWANRDHALHYLVFWGIGVYFALQNISLKRRQKPYYSLFSSHLNQNQSSSAGYLSYAYNVELRDCIITDK